MENGFDITVFLDGHTKNINKTLVNMSKDFIYIGFLLWEIQEYKYYESKYKSLIEYAEINFGFNKSSTYRFINICERFSERSQFDNPTMHLNDKYKDYSLSQLGELISMSDESIKQVTPEMTIKEIRQFKKSLAEQEKKEKVPTSGKFQISNYSISTINTWFDDTSQMDNFLKYVVETGIIDKFLRKELSNKVDEEAQVKTIEDYPQISVSEVPEKTDHEIDIDELKNKIKKHNKDFIDSIDVKQLVEEKGIEKIRLYINNAYQFKGNLFNAIKKELPIDKGDN